MKYNYFLYVILIAVLINDMKSCKRKATEAGGSRAQSRAGYKEALVIFKERRRPIRFETSSDPIEEHKNLLSAVEIGFKDIISSGFYLQIQNKEWNELTDVTGTVKDRSTLFLYCAAEDGKVGKGAPSMEMNLGSPSSTMMPQGKLVS